MNVGEAIKLLQDEDPNAELAFVARHLRFETIGQLNYRSKNFWVPIACDGKDTSSGKVYVVMICERNDE